MTITEKIELALVPLAGAMTWMLGDLLPAETGIGSLLLASSGLLLIQGLFRDLWLLSRRNSVEPQGEQHTTLCMCVESTVGVTGVVAGLIVLGTAVDWPLHISPLLWSLLAMAVLAVGFAIKDLIFEWRPFRVRRDKDHLNIVFSWKR
jgi:hypothetical protein